MKKNIVNFNEAERKARLRDIESDGTTTIRYLVFGFLFAIYAFFYWISPRIVSNIVISEVERFI